MNLPTKIASVVLNGTGDVTTVSGNRADLEVDTAGTHTAIGVGYWDSFLLTAGAYIDGGFVHNIAGSILVPISGTLTTTATWVMTADGTLQQLNSSGASKLFSITIDTGVEATLSGRVVLEFIDGDGTITGNNTTNFLFFNSPGANNFYSFTGINSAMLNILLTTATTRSLNQGITLVDVDMNVRRGTLVLGGDINLGTGDLLPSSDFGDGGIDMNGHNLSCNDVLIGEDNDATMDFGTGEHTINSDIKKAAGYVSGTLTIELSTSTIHLGGTFDGTTITVTASAAARIAVGDNSVAPTLTNVTVNNPLDASGVLDGGSNDSNIRFMRKTIGKGLAA